MKRKAILFITIFFSGCTLDIPDPDKLPVWSTALEVPIIETTIDLDEFLKDSLISTYPVGEGGDSIFVFNKIIYHHFLDEIFKGMGISEVSHG